MRHNIPPPGVVGELPRLGIPDLQITRRCEVYAPAGPSRSLFRFCSRCSRGGVAFQETFDGSLWPSVAPLSLRCSKAQQAKVAASCFRPRNVWISPLWAASSSSNFRFGLSPGPIFCTTAAGTSTNASAATVARFCHKRASLRRCNRNGWTNKDVGTTCLSTQPLYDS